MNHLIAGPDTMEMGWLVATWIPALRHIAPKFTRVTVICRPAHEYLYEFATDFIPYNPKGVADRWFFNGKKLRIHPSFNVPEPVVGKIVHLSPSKTICCKWKRDYVKYGEASKENHYDLVIHARSETKFAHKSNHKNRNWPVKNYVKVLKHIKPKRVCSIGTEKGASHVPGTEDLRGIQVGRLCDILASSRVLLTPSSGPGHLASLCGCAHVILTYDKYEKAIGGTNRDRYYDFWNPFKAPCKVLQNHNWQPPVKLVVKALGKFL